MPVAFAFKTVGNGIFRYYEQAALTVIDSSMKGQRDFSLEIPRMLGVTERKRRDV